MSQQEIYDYLKEKDWVTIREISEAIKSPINNVRLSLKQMLKYNEVLCKEIIITVRNQRPAERSVKHWKIK